MFWIICFELGEREEKAEGGNFAKILLLSHKPQVFTWWALTLAVTPFFKLILLTSYLFWWIAQPILVDK